MTPSKSWGSPHAGREGGRLQGARGKKGKFASICELFRVSSRPSSSSRSRNPRSNDCPSCLSANEDSNIDGNLPGFRDSVRGGIGARRRCSETHPCEGVRARQPILWRACCKTSGLSWRGAGWRRSFVMRRRADVGDQVKKEPDASCTGFFTCRKG